MASQPCPEIPGNFRFEFDAANRILLVRVEGRVTDKLVEDFFLKTRELATEMQVRASIVECSAVTELAVNSDFLRALAKRALASPDPPRRRFLVVARTAAYGLARMFQIAGESQRPYLEIVRTLPEVWAALGIRSPQFEPLK
jgi:hypothetical protein